MSAPRWPVAPSPPTAATAGWWEATRDKRLLVQQCDACGTCQHHPRAICTGCGRTDALGWLEASGRGRVLSHTVVHRSPSPELGDEPYLVALVELDEGVTMMSHVWSPNLDPADRSLDWCDEPVHVHWIAIEGDDRHLPLFLLDRDHP